MRTNPFQDTWQFLIGAQPDQLALGAWRWLLVALFLGLLLASFLLTLRSLADSSSSPSSASLSLLGLVLDSLSFPSLPSSVSLSLPPSSLPLSPSSLTPSTSPSHFFSGSGSHKYLLKSNSFLITHLSICTNGSTSHR